MNARTRRWTAERLSMLREVAERPRSSIDDDGAFGCSRWELIVQLLDELEAIGSPAAPDDPAPQQE